MFVVGWALASALFAQTGGGELPPLARLRVAEFETALAKGAGIYLVLDPGGKELEIKSRGLVLDRVQLDEILVLEFRPLFVGGKAPTLEAPAVWKISEGPGDSDRETIAPPELRPYSDEPEEEAAPGATNTPASKKKPDEDLTPSTYRVALENGWQIYITPEVPRAGFFRRLGAAARDGWLRLRGKEPSHPRLAALVMPAASGQRLHHLFRTGTEILVLP